MSDDSDTTGAEWAQGPPIPQSDLPVWVYPNMPTGDAGDAPVSDLPRPEES